MVEADQAPRRGQIDKEAAHKVDVQNTARLKQIIDTVGWPKMSMVGRDGVRSAFLIVLHADDDRAFQENILKLMEPLVDSSEVPGMYYAYLYDRLHTPQRYGTQGKCGPDGSFVPFEIEDRDHLNERRAAMGVIPEKFEDYARDVAKIACKPKETSPQGQTK